MLSQARFYGGALSSSAQATKLPLAGARVVAIQPSGLGGGGAPVVLLPRPDRATLGGFYFLILNRDVAGGSNLSVQLYNGTEIAEIAPEGAGYVFLLDREANSGNGQWLVKGTGTITTGDQGSSGYGFRYGTAGTTTGFSLDFGSAGSPNSAFNEAPTDFGTGPALPANPPTF